MVVITRVRRCLRWKPAASCEILEVTKAILKRPFSQRLIGQIKLTKASKYAALFVWKLFNPVNSGFKHFD
jgi:hypothetical protein